MKMGADDPERAAAMPVTLKAELDAAKAQLAALKEAGVMGLQKAEIVRLKEILREDNERAIVYAYVRRRFRMWGTLLIATAATLAAFREDVSQLLQFLRDALSHRPPGP